MSISYYHEQDDDVYDRDGHANEYGQSPFCGDGVYQRERERTDVVEHVGCGHQSASQLRLANFADVRGTRSTRIPDAYAHQNGAHVQRFDAARVEQYDLRHYVRHVGQEHAFLVSELAQRYRRECAS